jgi:hypothetical protein
MMEDLVPSDMGLAEFMAKLIDETFEAVAASQAEQEQRHRRLLEMSGLSLDEFASRVITDDEIERELARLFPSESEDRLHGIYPGARYQPQAHDVFAPPPAIRTMLGLELHRSEYRVTRQRGATSLKREAVEKIRESLRLRIAAVRLAAIQQAVERGVPQVIVDSGRIDAKLTFQVIRTEDADTPKLRDRLASPSYPLSSINMDELSKVRLVVRQADEKAPQTSNLQANVFGEVEITFKTIL